jgi:hypothetical protein
MRGKRARSSSLSTLQRSKTNQQPSAWPRLLKQRYHKSFAISNRKMDKRLILYAFLLQGEGVLYRENDEIKEDIS